MIVEWLVKLTSTIAGVVVGLFPDDPLPAFMTDAAGQINKLFVLINGLGAWAPWTYIGVVFTVVLSTYGICLAVKVGLRAVSHSPVSGGAG